MATRQLSVVPHQPFAPAMLATAVVLMILTLLPRFAARREHFQECGLRFD
jgi:hypothetical protein